MIIFARFFFFFFILLVKFLQNSSSEWNYLDQVQQQQVIPATRDLIRRTIRQALVQYQRDALWQTILESDNSKGTFVLCRILYPCCS
jgi:hypothetical protein